MKNNKNKLSRKKIIKGGGSLQKEEPKLELDGLDLTFITKLASTSAKVIAGGIVFGVEHLFASISSRNPKPLSKETIHESIQILNNKMNSVEVFLKSQEGQQVLRELRGKLTILANEISKVASGPLKILTDSFLDLIMETGEKFIKKGSKLGKNVVKIVPGVGDAFIIAENIGTSASVGSDAIASFIKSSSILFSFIEKSSGNVGQISSAINEVKATISPIISLITAVPDKIVGQIPLGDINKAIQGGTKELSENIDRITNTSLMVLNQATKGGSKKGGTRRRKRKTTKTKKIKNK
jgi:hypothetical protein